MRWSGEGSRHFCGLGAFVKDVGWGLGVVAPRGLAVERSLCTRARRIRLAVAMACSALACLAFGSEQASATPLPTTISSNMTLTAADSPYTGSSVTIASGVTVTAEPGAVVKLTGSLSVSGTLDAQGTATNPVVFTSSQDSAAGQWNGIDLNSGSGASVLSHIQLRYADYGIGVYNGVSPQITDSTVRNNSVRGIEVHAGGSPDIARNTVSSNGAEGIYYKTGLSSQQGTVKIHDNVVQNNAGDGIYLKADYSNAVSGNTLGGNTITGNGGRGIYYGSGSNNLPADIDENTLSGNGQNGAFIGGYLTSSTTWENRGYPIVLLAGQVTVDSGATLTLGPGLILKGEPAGGALSVSGNVQAIGTQANPITFTSLKDDSVGGDTNGDGAASNPAPGDWRGIDFNTGSGASVLSHIELRYADYGIGVYNGVSPQITDSTIRNNLYRGIEVTAGGSPEIARNTVSSNGIEGIYYKPVSTSQQGTIKIHDNTVNNNAGDGIYVSLSGNYNVTGTTLGANTVTSNGGKGIYYLSPNPLPSDVDDNTVTGNAKNAIWLAGRVASSATWENRGYPIVLLAGQVTVDSGATLTLGPGLILKGEPAGGALSVSGNVQAIGTQANPITFTSLKDDSVGGDTNGDGAASAPAGGDWAGIVFNSGSTNSGTGSLDNTKIMYGGRTLGNVTVYCSCPTPPTITHSTIANSRAVGLYVNGNPGGSGDMISWSKFSNNPSYAIQKAGTTQLLARHNDFNSASGPKPAGSGDAVSSLVTYQPFVSAQKDTCHGQDHQCGHGGDPVSLATGELNYSHTDLELTGKGLPLVFSRAYNSQDPTDAGLGPGWSHYGLISATELENGDVVIRRADGRGDLFTKTQSGYTPPSGVSDTLVRNGDGTYKLTALDRTVYDFDSSGRITRITDDHGLATKDR